MYTPYIKCEGVHSCQTMDWTTSRRSKPKNLHRSKTWDFINKRILYLSNKKCDPNKSDWMAGECLNMVFLLQEISANCSFQKENDDEAVDGRGSSQQDSSKIERWSSAAPCHPSWIFRWKQPSQFMNTRWYPLVDIAMENHHCFFFPDKLSMNRPSIYLYIL